MWFQPVFCYAPSVGSAVEWRSQRLGSLVEENRRIGGSDERARASGQHWVDEKENRATNDTLFYQPLSKFNLLRVKAPADTMNNILKLSSMNSLLASLKILIYQKKLRTTSIMWCRHILPPPHLLNFTFIVGTTFDIFSNEIFSNQMQYFWTFLSR